MTSEFAGLTEGATWNRCAFQVNPYSYLEANGRSTQGLGDEASYNASIVAALLSNGIRVIAVTDHWCVDSGASLREAAEAAGITVFPGFEATAKDGVHLLVLFDPGTSPANINRHIGECGIPADCHESRPGSQDTLELLECAERWGAVIIAPHVTSGGGLLDKLSGQTAVQAWTDPRLHAVALSGGVPSQGHAAILANRDLAYKRGNPVARLRAADVSHPSDLVKPGSSCWIKLSSLTINGLDLAFRTPETRVSQEDPQGLAHPRLIGVRWEGGFLDEVKIRLNESLNVLIGGRGSGKSTVIESIRYALEIAPLAAVSQATHDSMIRDVLGSGAKVTLEVEVRTPSPTIFTIERLVGSKSVVRDSAGALLQSAPGDVLRGTEVYGQRELAELARNKQQLTALLAQYLPDSNELGHAVSTHARNLERSRLRILALQQDLDGLDARLARMPIVKERLARFDEAGVGEKLQEQDRAQQEEQLLSRALASVQAIPQVLDELTMGTDYLVDEVARNLPRATILEPAKTVLDSYNASVKTAIEALSAARLQAVGELKAIETEWSDETSELRDSLAKVLRELQPDGIDGDEYLRLRRELGELTPLTAQRSNTQAELDRIWAERDQLLIDAEDRRGARLRALQKEAKKVGRSLPGVVQASVRDGEDRSGLTDLLDQRVSGRLDRVRAAINSAASLSPRAFVASCREGVDAILSAYPSVTENQANLLCSASAETLMLVEEVELPISTDLQLNVGSKESPTWRSLDQLSTGQKATALLLLLMHRGDGPLIIDQPEDDLDNRFIYEDIVPRLRATKGQRQVIVSSHNANIPVLGDADQIVSLVAEDSDGGVCGRIVDDGLGSIDHPPVRAMVEELLEGGREAFNTRRYLYGF